VRPRLFLTAKTINWYTALDMALCDRCLPVNMNCALQVLFTEDGVEQHVAAMDDVLSLSDGAFVSLRLQDHNAERTSSAVVSATPPSVEPVENPSGAADVKTSPMVAMAGMTAADSCEQQLCRVAAMQNACAQQLQAACTKATAQWRQQTNAALSKDAACRLAQARESLGQNAGIAVAEMASLSSRAVRAEDIARATQMLVALRAEVIQVAAIIQVNPSTLCCCAWHTVITVGMLYAAGQSTRRSFCTFTSRILARTHDSV
jgi:hypothetical protein